LIESVATGTGVR